MNNFLKRQSMWSLLCSSLTMLFSVNCETRKVIVVIRNMPSLKAVNCPHDLPPPPLRPLITPRKITLLKHKPRTEQRIRCGQKCRYFEDICFSFRGRTQINSKRGVVTNSKIRNELEPATSTSKNSNHLKNRLVSSVIATADVTFRRFDFIT